jgi:hypothetical protein
MKLADVALGDRMDANAEVSEPLEKASHIFLISGKTIERFRDDSIERAWTLPSTLKQQLEAGPVLQPRAGDRRIGKDINDIDSHLRSVFAAQTNLILDRRFGLEVAGISRVNDGFHHAVLSIFPAGMLSFAGRISRNRSSAAWRPSNLANRKICSSLFGPPHWPLSVPAQALSSGDRLARIGCTDFASPVVLLIRPRWAFKTS